MKAAEFKEIGFFADVLSAKMLSETMLADWDKGGRNLNKISHDSAIGLIKKVRDELGFKVTRVYLDTVGSPQKYKIIIEQALADSSIQVVVESKADDTYPVVSAASICAKVTRDHALNDYVYPEVGREFSRTVGCGYPGDKITVGWLNDHRDPVFGWPSIVRFSWKTCYEKLDKDN
jgi:ribonuclease H2 subunit A